MSIGVVSKKIGDWTEDKLARFIATTLSTSNPSLPPSLTLKELKTTRKLTVSDEIVLSPQAVRQLKNYLGLP